MKGYVSVDADHNKIWDIRCNETYVVQYEHQKHFDALVPKSWVKGLSHRRNTRGNKVVERTDIRETQYFVTENDYKEMEKQFLTYGETLNINDPFQNVDVIHDEKKKKNLNEEMKHKDEEENLKTNKD